MKRAITPKTFEPRKWQQEADIKLMERWNAREKAFLCVATPGAGKTKFALMIAHRFLLNRWVSRVVVLTPSDHLKTQWAYEAASFAGIDLNPNFSNKHHIEGVDYHGVAITYSLLGMDKHNVHAQACFNQKTLVILDEPHHLGDALTWGNAAINAFESAVFIIGLSGTLFRSDDAKIPFVEYENGESKAHYYYGYEQALRDNVVRPIFFPIVEGKFKYKVGDNVFEHTFQDYIAQDLKSKRLRAAIEAEGGFVWEYLTQANNKLKELRVTHPSAGGLIAARDQQHARRIAKILQQLTGVLPPVAVSDDTASRDIIKQFTNSSDPWLVSVRMVSEGVDIPRLRVGGYLTVVKKELFFRQLVGRFVRMMKTLGYQDAYVFIPGDKDIVKLAKQINEERDHVLAEAESCEPLPNLFGEKPAAIKGEFEVLETQATGTRVIAVNMSSRSHIKRRVIEYTPTEELPVFEQERRLRNTINSLNRTYAIRLSEKSGLKADFSAGHNAWIKAGGDSIDKEGLDVLRERRLFFENLVRSV